MIPLSFMEEINDTSEETQEETQEEVQEDGSEDTIDWEAKAKEQEGLAKRNYAKLKKAEEKLASLEKKPEPPKEEKKLDDKEFSSGDKALLKTYKDIQGEDELALAQNWMKRTGDEMEVMLEDELFNSKLNKLREKKKAKEAVPTSTRRSGVPSSKAVDYWLGKPFEEVPRDPPELRQQVLAERLKREEHRAKFGR
jgi:hypothetical protein